MYINSRSFYCFYVLADQQIPCSFNIRTTESKCFSTVTANTCPSISYRSTNNFDIKLTEYCTMHKYGAVLYEIIVPVNVHFLREIL